METHLKQRLVGAIVLVLLSVVILPILFDTPRDMSEALSTTSIPERPQSGFESKAIVPGKPETPRLDAAVERERNRHAPDAAAALAAPPRPARQSESTSTRTGSTPVKKTSVKKTPTTPAPGGWAIQLGSFQQSRNALALRDRLRAKGYTVFVESGFSAHGEVSRVFIGPVLEVESVKTLAVELQREMQIKGIVVPYPGG